MKALHILIPTLAVSLSGCLLDESKNKDSGDASSDDDTSPQLAQIDFGEMIVDSDRLMAVATVTPDYSTSDIALVRSGSTGMAELSQGQFETTNPSDTTVSTYGASLYRIGKYRFDNVTKYSLNDDLGADLVWQYSVNGPDDTENSTNPYQVVFERADRAFVIRYDSSEIWVIDPSVEASGDDSFKLGEIDLSAYAHDGSGGIPRMNAGLVSGGRLYVLMQRLNSDYTATESSYVAVFDLTDPNLAEIDTTMGAEGLKGVELGIGNAQNMDIQGNTLYVAGTGNGAFSASPDYDGGVVAIDTTDFSSELLVDDGDSASHPYGPIFSVEVATKDHGYFVGRNGLSDYSLYHFDPDNASTTISAVDGLQNVSISDLAHEMLNDSSARYADLLYVGVHADSTDTSSNGRVEIVNVLDQSILGEIPLNFNPTNIEFMDR